ncbi:MAG: hypothetical protein ACI8QZ_003754 [Chlamydiales bacterium]|jgi:hypothetical protein
MTKRSQRGAARISAVWMIGVIVLFFVAMAFGYISQQDLTNAEARLAGAVASEADSVARADVEAKRSLDITKVLGFAPKDEIGARANLTAAAEGFGALKATFSDIDDSVTTFAETVPLVVAQYAAKGREIETLNSQISTLRSERDAARSSLNDVTAAKDGEIRDLQSQLTDATNAARDMQTELEERVASVTADRNDRDNQLRSARGELQDSQRDLYEEQQAATSRFKQLSKLLAFTKEPSKPDGVILAASNDLGLAWINLGRVNRLKRGMRFDVVSGQANSDTHKGVIEVTQVDDTRAEVRMIDVTDPFDPIVTDDQIVNPLYDPTGVRNAVLIGRFSARYNEKELRLLLDEIGVAVQKRIDNDSAYLIVGEALYQDENGEAYEEPVQPSELPEYKQAQAKGVQIVSIRELESFFK